jgi:predicted nucleic acid-binding protein
MSQIVVDTDVASYIFNWHSSAQRYIDALRGCELILSFMSIAELRMGAIAAGWGVRRRAMLEHFIRGFGVVYAGDALCTSWARLRAEARATGRSLSPQALGLDVPLATNNRSDFERVPKLRLLTV